MLILVFRGIFLIGILSWYSINVWKMIDGYFKERFDKYLQQEFQKNPKMRDDIEAHKKSIVDSLDGSFEGDVEIKTTISPIHYQQGSCNSLDDLGEEVCPVDEPNMEKMAGDDRSEHASILTTEKRAINVGQQSESEVISKGATDKNLFDESSTVKFVNNVDEKMFAKEEATADVTNDKSTKSLLTAEIKSITDNLNENVTSKITTVKDDSPEVTTQIANDPAITDSSKDVGKKTKNRKSKLRKRPRILTNSEEMKEIKGKKKKLRVKTIAFTEEDFKQAKLRGGWQDNDFTEFDDEDENGTNEPPEGILVSQLPFKPRADIGNLERVTDDEFCPLTLEDEANCDEIKTWP